jgi:chemotaxis protein CheX
MKLPMRAEQEINEALIKENIVRAMASVFETMLRRPIELAGVVESGPWLTPANPDRPEPQVVGIVGFLGEVNGLIYLYFENSFAVECTSILLGITAFEATAAGDETVNDAIGEISNMIVGSFKSGLYDTGLSCRLTVPSILRASDFRIEATRSAKRLIYLFNCSGRRVVAEIVMTIE